MKLSSVLPPEQWRALQSAYRGEPAEQAQARPRQAGKPTCACGARLQGGHCWRCDRLDFKDQSAVRAEREAACGQA